MNKRNKREKESWTHSISFGCILFDVYDTLAQMLRQTRETVSRSRFRSFSSVQNRSGFVARTPILRCVAITISCVVCSVVLVLLLVRNCSFIFSNRLHCSVSLFQTIVHFNVSLFPCYLCVSCAHECVLLPPTSPPPLLFVSKPIAASLCRSRWRVYNLRASVVCHHDIYHPQSGLHKKQSKVNRYKAIFTAIWHGIISISFSMADKLTAKRGEFTHFSNIAHIGIEHIVYMCAWTWFLTQSLAMVFA